MIGTVVRCRTDALIDVHAGSCSRPRARVHRHTQTARPVFAHEHLAVRRRVSLRRPRRRHLQRAVVVPHHTVLPEPLAHQSQLRPRHAPRMELFRRRRPHIDRLRISVQRLRDAVVLDLRAQYIRCRPRRLLLAEADSHRPGRVVDERHQTRPRPPPLEPVVKAAIELPQLPERRAPRTAHMDRLCAALPTPQVRADHPAPQGRHGHEHPELGP